jgi:hypothetical protein
MREYGKTENLFTRNPETHKLNDGDLRDPAFGQIAGWTVTEKIDGTNIRVLLRLDGHNGTDMGERLGEPVRSMQVEVLGRSDKANVPGDLKDAILATIQENWASVFAWVEELTGDDDAVQVCLYGEGYGAGIQKVGVKYRSDKGLRIFDVVTTRLDHGTYGPQWWREWSDVEDAARACGFATVPLLLVGAPLDEVVALVHDQRDGRFPSLAAPDGADLIPEGVVARTDPYLYDFRGHRVLFKLKAEDLA